MRDALTTLIHAAQSSPDLELLPWVEKELSRLAYRHYGEDAVEAARFLGTTAAMVTQQVAGSSGPGPAPALPTVTAPATKRAGKKAG